MTKLRILLVEDDVGISGLYTDVLDGMGHVVCGIAASQAEAIASAANSKPDLMIVDARLASGSGEQAMNDILRNGHVPHIFVSGDTARISALRPTAVVLQKPFFVADLARAIMHALAVAAPPPQLASTTMAAPIDTRL